MNDFLEFNDADGEGWRVEAGSALRKAFEIHGSSEEIEAKLREWHSVLWAYPELWNVVAWRYGVRPQFGVSDPKRLRAWSREEVAVELGKSVLEIEAREMAATKCWRMRPVGGASSPAASDGQAKPASAMLATPDAPPMEAEDAVGLLRQFGFAEVVDEAERKYIAERIIALNEVLESDSQAARLFPYPIHTPGSLFVLLSGR